MVLQLKVFRAVGVALGFCHVLGVQGRWMGRMAEPNDLLGRQIKCPDAGFVGCGDLGCLPQDRCCNPDGGCKFFFFNCL